MFDVENILNQLTLEEKVLLCQAKDMWNTNGVERLGIPGICLTDGPNGVRYNKPGAYMPEPSTAIPTESILSASWDRALIREVATLLAEECHHYGIHVLLAPGANSKRSPLGGRNFEYYSEDPYLSGTMATEMISAMQANGVGTSMKHFVANDQETRRFTEDTTVDERTLREICLKPFEMAVKKAKPWTIMAAYPKLRGRYLCENSYALQNVLRKEYGFDGVVLSDWGATVNKVESHRNGLDLETGSFYRMHELLQAVQSGELSETILDDHVRNVLTLIRKALEGQKEMEADWNAHHRLAQKASAECAVLLKNEANILPLSKDANIAVVGKFAEVPHIRGGGSSGTNSGFIDVPLDCLRHYATVSYAPGYETEQTDPSLLKAAQEAACGKDAVVVMIGTTDLTESEGCDRVNMLLPQSHVDLVLAVAEVNPNVIVVNSSGAPVEFRQIADRAKAILHMGLGGEGMGQACADLLFGAVNPSGKLTETFPVRIENTPTYPFYPGYDDNVIYHEELLVGYRYYDTKQYPVQYPFGYGLSYTTFEYSDLTLSSKELKNGEPLTVSLRVKNTGRRAGAEVVQFYVADPVSYMPRPAKELKEFVKVELLPGEEKEISVQLDDEAFAYYVPHLGRYAVESGEFIIMAAASSRDIRLQDTVTFRSCDDVRLPLNGFNTMGEYYADDRYERVTKKVYEKLGITEDHFMFPILSSITVNQLAMVMGFPGVQIGADVDVPGLQKCLIENRWEESTEARPDNH